ncbi:MAG TPA: GNAT family N-acetyltransferase [Azospirillaceae bacterium]|nr:GNAT family N-acetyltransferase [Azospirillaceae bacterium]
MERDVAHRCPPPAGKLEVTVTYLEMMAPPLRRPVPLPGDKVTLVRAEQPTVSFYRYLYDTVGEPWLWSDRRRLSAERLATIIENPMTEVWVLHVAGTPAGYGELDRRNPAVVELAYFGLLPNFIGRNLGPYLLDRMIARAWTSGTWRLGVNTCSFDHPKALPLYCRLGFQPVRTVTKHVADPRIEGVLPLWAAPHLPLACVCP